MPLTAEQQTKFVIMRNTLNDQTIRLSVLVEKLKAYLALSQNVLDDPTDTANVLFKQEIADIANTLLSIR